MITLIMAAVSIICALSVGIFAVVGFFKGWKKCLFGLCQVLSAALLSFICVFAFCHAFPSEILYKTFIEPLIGHIDIISDSAAIQEMGGRIVYTVLMPFAFTLLFYLFYIILLIPAKYILRALKIKENSEHHHKPTEDEEISDHSSETPLWAKMLMNLGGVLIRLVTATLVIIMVLFPFSGIIYTVTDGIILISDTAAAVDADFDLGEKDMNILDHVITDEEGHIVTSEVSALVHETLDPVRSNIFLKLSYSKPVRFLHNSMIGNFKTEGTVENEISQLFGIVANTVYFTVEPEEYGQAQKDAITNIFAYVSASELHSRVGADILSGMSNNIIEGKTVFGKDFSNLKEGDKEIICTPVLEIFKETTPETVISDVNSLRDILIIMIDYRVPADLAVALEEGLGDKVFDIFANEELLYEVLVTIYHNEDFRHLTGPAINFMFTVFTRKFDADTEPMYVAGEEIENLTDEDLREEARIFTSLIGNITVVMDSVPAITESSNTMQAIVSANMESLGNFVDDARSSRMIGDGVTELLLVILDSESMNSMRDVADIMSKHIREDENLDISNLFIAVQQFVSILDKYENGDGHDTTELAKSLGDLNKTFEKDQKTGAILKEIINDTDMINSSSLSSGGEQNDSSQKMMNVFIDKLSSKEYTDEELEKEAKALDYSMQLIQASGQENSSEKLKEVYGGDKMNEMIDVMADSDISSAAINEVAYDEEGNLTSDALELSESMDAEDRENFRNECENTYNAKIEAFTSDQSRTEEEIAEYKEILKTNMNSLASIFGETLDFDAWEKGESAN